MPELPEVETMVRDLSPLLIGRILSNPRLFKNDVLRNTSRARLVAGLRGQEVIDVNRRAKHVVMFLDNGLRLIIQPRMTGTLLVYRGRLPADERRYAVLQVSIGHGASLVYRDVRRLGTVWLLDEDEWTAYTDRIGPEPLTRSFTLTRFGKQLRGTRQAIKKAIMDQRRIAGIGNIYANEALFRAGIDPLKPTNLLGPTELGSLYREVRRILREALAAHGTTVRDYRTGTGEAGSFQYGLQVYGRGGEPCIRCGQVLTTTHSVDGRATTYCGRCQS